MHNGLIKLVCSSGNWSIDGSFPIGDMRYMTGPDSYNRLYCSFGGNPAGVYVFDCTTEQVVDTIPLNHYPKGLALSPDETKLYVAAWEWPSLQEYENPVWSGGPEIPSEYLEKGLLLEIAISSHVVLRSVNTGSFPQEIYYADLPADDMILVSTGQYTNYPLDLSYEQEISGTFSILDIVNVSDFSVAQPRLEVPSGGSFSNWLYDNALSAFSTETLNRINIAPQELQNGILLIDPVAGIVSSSIPVRGTGDISGSYRLICSTLVSDRLYVCRGTPQLRPQEPYDWVIAIDRLTGDLLESYNIGPVDELPSDILETPCGDLIITALDGENGYINIFERENPPVCILDLVTPMPHIGDGIVEFDATTSYNPDPCDTLMYEWDFDADGIFGEPVDDSYTGPDDNPTHTYPETYHGPAFLRLTDSDNLYSFGVVNVMVIIE